MNSRERDLFESRGGDAFNFADERIDRHASRTPPRGWDDAVRARLRASGLHAQRERRAPCRAWLDRRSAAAVAFAEALGCREVDRFRRRRKAATPKDWEQPRFVVVGNHADDIGKLAHIVGAPRRVTPGDHDARARIGSGDAPNRLARALIGRGSHRTRVHDNHVRGFGRRRLCANRAQLLLEAEGVGLVDATSEGDHGVLHALRHHNGHKGHKVRTLLGQVRPSGSLVSFVVAKGYASMPSPRCPSDTACRRTKSAWRLHTRG